VYSSDTGGTDTGGTDTGDSASSTLIQLVDTSDDACPDPTPFTPNDNGSVFNGPMGITTDYSGRFVFISDSLNGEGIVLISECFDGVYDFWPTHLYANEEFSASLELLMAPYFYLDDVNTQPFGKPYFFRKKLDTTIKNNTHPLFSKASLVGSFIRLKNKIGY
jgi:hypothetical protein